MHVIAKGKCDYFDDISKKVEISVDTDADLDAVITRITYAKKILEEIEYIFSKTSVETYERAQRDCKKFECKQQEGSDYWDMMLSNGAVEFTMIDVISDDCAIVFAENDIYNFTFHLNNESIIGIGCHQKETKKGNE